MNDTEVRLKEIAILERAAKRIAQAVYAHPCDGFDDGFNSGIRNAALVLSELVKSIEDEIYPMTTLTENTHPSHDWHPNDDIISCVLCGCRTYNDEAKQPCEGAT